MPSFHRNLLVGITMLTALVLLGWMLVRFGDRPAAFFAPPRMPVQLVAPRADGIGDGSPLFYRGVNVGRVDRVRRTQDQLGVVIHAQVDRTPQLPGNIEGVIRSQGLVGTASAITFELLDPDPIGTLEENQVLPARFVGLDLLPSQFAELAEELRQVSQQMRQARLIESIADMARNIDQQVTRAGEMIESVNELLTDQQLRQDLQESLAQVRTASEHAARSAESIERFTGRLDEVADEATQAIQQTRSTLARTEEQVDRVGQLVADRLIQSARMLDNIQSITMKIDRGRGTAGLIVNDPRLYESLVLTTQELNLMVTDLRRLLEQWEQEGVTVRPR